VTATGIEFSTNWVLKKMASIGKNNNKIKDVDQEFM